MNEHEEPQGQDVPEGDGERTAHRDGPGTARAGGGDQASGKEALERFKAVLQDRPAAPEARAHRAQGDASARFRPALRGLGPRLAAAARAHPNWAVFVVGVILFASGLVGVLGSQTGPDAVSRMVAGSASTPGSAATAQIGPGLGEPLEPYIQSKRDLLAQRAESDPGISTLALIVFGSYRSAPEVEQFLADRSLSGLAAQVRVPVEGIQPVHVPLVGRALAGAAVWQARTVHEQLAVLEEVASEAEGEQYRSIYERELQRHREAVAVLEQPNPATIFAVVTHASYQALSRVATAAEVRFVDVPVDPTLALQDTDFGAPIPEDTERVSTTP